MIINSILQDTYKDCAAGNTSLLITTNAVRPDGVSQANRYGSVAIIGDSVTPTSPSFVYDNLYGLVNTSAVLAYKKGANKTYNINDIKVDIPITDPTFGTAFSRGTTFEVSQEYNDSYGNGEDLNSDYEYMEYCYPYNGSITINKQEDLDAITSSVHAITGDLIIEDNGSGTAITNLSKLFRLQWIGGNLVIKDCAALTDDNFEQMFIRWVKGDITFDNNDLITSLIGFIHIEEIWGNLTITNNAALTDLMGMRYLRVQSGTSKTLTITGNPSLKDGKDIRGMIHPLNGFAAWSAGTYNKYDKVVNGGEYYVAKTTTTETPSNTATDWFRYYEDSLSLGGFTTITINTNDATGNINSLNSLLEEDAVWFGFKCKVDINATKWGHVSSRPYVGTYNAATTYGVHNIVYSPTTGIFYRNKVSGTTGVDPAVDCSGSTWNGSRWERFATAGLHSRNDYRPHSMPFMMSFSRSTPVRVTIPSKGIDQTYTCTAGLSKSLFDDLATPIIYNDPDFTGDVNIQILDPYAISSGGTYGLYGLQFGEQMNGAGSLGKYSATIQLGSAYTITRAYIDGVKNISNGAFSDLRYCTKCTYASIYASIYQWADYSPVAGTDMYDTFPRYIDNMINLKRLNYLPEIPITNQSHWDMSRTFRKISFLDYQNSITLSNIDADLNLSLFDPESNLKCKKIFGYSVPSYQGTQYYEQPSFRTSGQHRRFENVSHNIRFPFPNSGNFGGDGTTPLRRMPDLTNFPNCKTISTNQLAPLYADPTIEGLGWENALRLGTISMVSMWGRFNSPDNSGTNIGWNKDNGIKFLINLINFVEKHRRLRKGCFWDRLVVNYQSHGLSTGRIYMSRNTWYHDNTPIMFKGVQVSFQDIINILKGMNVIVIVS